jgi:hypothetical protein
MATKAEFVDEQKKILHLSPHLLARPFLPCLDRDLLFVSRTTGVVPCIDRYAINEILPLILADRCQVGHRKSKVLHVKKCCCWRCHAR